MKKISIIVPVYQVENYLDACICSIVNQTYKNLEILLIDDGSTDNSSKICDKWAERDNRIVVIHKENGGAGLARNIALDLATGEYVGFVDSDDYISPNFIEILQSKMHSGIDIVECGYVSVYEDEYKFDMDITVEEAITEYNSMEAMQENISDRLFRQLIWNKLYRRETIGDIRFPIDKKIDDEFWTYQVIGRAKKLAHINLNLYAYRQQDNSIMHIIKLENRIQALEALVEKHRYIKSFYPQLEAESTNKVWFACLYFGQIALKSRNSQLKEEIIDYIRMIMKEIPLIKLDKFSRKDRIWLLMAERNFKGICAIRNLMKIGL